MKRLILAAFAAAATAFGQAPAPAPVVETPTPKCEEPDKYPGRIGMQTESIRKRFLKSIETYKTCMVGFVEERKALIKANETAARVAIETFNAKMKVLNDEQEANQ